MCDVGKIRAEIEKLEEALNTLENGVEEGDDEKVLENLDFARGIINCMKNLLSE